MAVSDPCTFIANGVRHWSWKLAASGGITTTDELEITNVPVPSRLVHLDAALTTGGSATTIQPRVGYAAEFVASSINEAGQVSAAAARVSTSPSATIHLRREPDGEISRSIFVRWVPDTNTGGTGAATAYVTVVEGAA